MDERKQSKSATRRNKELLFFLGIAIVVVLAILLTTPKTETKADDSGTKADIKSTCLACHGDAKITGVNIKEFMDRGDHTNHDCSLCHSDWSGHLTNPTKVHVETNINPENCGQCHIEQYETYFKVNYNKSAKKEKSTPTGRAPGFDEVMQPHAFTYEHNEPRSHAFLLIDHMIVDRAYNGRFQLKNWTLIDKSPNKLWDVVIDTNTTLPYTGKGGNTVCLSCKTTDQILLWPYMGNPSNYTDLKRGGNADAINMAKKYLQNPMSCIHCHDPHSTEPRVVRDALIQAVVDRGEGTYPYNKTKSQEITMTKVVFTRGGEPFRAIGILNKYDSNLLCGQCHVEYIGNPGIDTTTKANITFSDIRTNVFPWTNVFDAIEFYDNLSFRDFRHSTTNATLIKVQHPEVEVFWGSKHEIAGLECQDCHMPKITEGDKTYTSHWQTSFRNYDADLTCARSDCHSDWNKEESVYYVDSIKEYIKGKERDAEFWLRELITNYETAKTLGVNDTVLSQAREKHDSAHILWEWWTAENSDGFHNPTQARESLGESIEISKSAVKLLKDEIAKVKIGGEVELNLTEIEEMRNKLNATNSELNSTKVELDKTKENLDNVSKENEDIKKQIDITKPYVYLGIIGLLVAITSIFVAIGMTRGKK